MSDLTLEVHEVELSLCNRACTVLSVGLLLRSMIILDITDCWTLLSMLATVVVVELTVGATRYHVPVARHD